MNEQNKASYQSTEKLWNAFVELDQFLHFEFSDFLNNLVVVKPNEWEEWLNKPMEILEAERSNVPKSIHWQADEAIRYFLVPKLNELLGILQDVIDARHANDSEAEAQILRQANRHIAKLKEDFRAETT